MLYTKLDTLHDVKKFDINPYRGKPVLVFIYMKGCPYCDMMEPEWKRFRDNNTMVNTLDINNSVIDEFKRHKPFFDVDDMYFPSLKLTQNDKTIKYDGDRTSNDIRTFVVNNVKSKKPKEKEIEGKKKEENKNKKSKDNNSQDKRKKSLKTTTADKKDKKKKEAKKK